MAGNSDRASRLRGRPRWPSSSPSATSCPSSRPSSRSSPVEGAISLDELRERGRARAAGEVAERVAAVRPEDPYTIIYTSGTTGPPKGCVLSHGNYRSVTRMCEEIDVIVAGEPVYLFLPLAHSYALLIQLLCVDLGAPLDLLERRPAADRPGPDGDQAGLPARVPRIFEKIYTLVTSNNDPEKIAAATQLGLQVRRMQEAGQEVPEPLPPRSTRPTPSCSSTSATSSAGA